MWVSFQFINIIRSIVVTILSNTIDDVVCLFKSSGNVGIVANLSVVTVMSSLHEQTNQPALSVTTIGSVKSISDLREEAVSTTRKQSTKST